MSSQSVLAFGNFRKAERIDLTVLAQEAALELRFTESTDDAAQWLETNHPRALLLDDKAEHAAQMCQVARSRIERALVPIISVAKELDDLSFEEIFSWGGDDAVELGHLRHLLARIRALPADNDASPPSLRGTAVVADPDRARRLVRARVLRNAGYSVRFAAAGDDVVASTRDGGPNLLVIDAELAEPLPLLEACGAGLSETNIVVLCPPKQVAATSEQLGTWQKLSVSDSFAPPENVLFIVNELLRGGTSDKRASRRLLYGAKVSFRGEGRERDDFGFTYNISAGGMYVRTLAPPSDNLVWLELQPPRSDRKVRLEGEVVWRRPFGPSSHATVPAGFGVRIVDGTRRNMEAWLNGYNSFVEALGLGPAVSVAS